MSIPKPIDEIAETFNAAVDLAGADVAGLEQAAWRFRLLLRRKREDVLAELGLMHVYEMLGRRDDAVELSGLLWDRRFAMSANDRQALAVLEFALGHHAHASELVAINAADPSQAIRVQSATTAAMLILATWDDDLISKYVRPEHRNLASFSAELSSANLLRCMASRQAVVSDRVASLLCGQEVSFGADGDDGMRLTRYLYVAAGYDERQELASAIDGDLDEFYLSHGIEPAMARSLLSELVLPVAARFPVGEGLAHEMA